MALKNKNRNWEPQNARNYRNYMKDPNAVTGALFRQSEGKGLTDAQRQELRQMVAGEKYMPPDGHQGDPNVMAPNDESILRQAVKVYHNQQQLAKQKPMNKFKDAMRGSIEGMPPHPQPKPNARPMPGGGRGYGRPGWGQARPPRPTWGAGSGVQPGSQPKKRPPQG